ncbi:MAG: lipopolysaccharide biosynthesis protein [Desulfovibrionales bacterium]
MENNADIRTYLDVWKRRKLQFIIPAVIVFLLVAVITILLPNVYRSTSTILIESQNIPRDMVRTTVTGYIEERLQSISQKVLGRVNLLGLIEKHGLYQDLRSTMTSEEIVEKMQEDVILEPIQTEVINPDSGRESIATIAFSISYEGKEPRTVARVVDDLTSMFLEENLRNRELKARTTEDFLRRQRERLAADIRDYEHQIAVFKDENLNSLPELMELNMQNLERVEKEISAKEEDIKSLTNRRIYLEGQLATIDPSSSERMPSTREELETLRREYIGLQSSLSSTHPDVIKMKKRIDALEKAYDIREDQRTVLAAIREKEDDLSVLRDRYTEMHPDVIAARKELAQLQTRADDIARNPALFNLEIQNPENPAYINLQTQIESTNMEIGKAEQELARLKTRYENYSDRIERTPQVEQVYKVLLRDYDNAQEQYEATAARLMSAEEARVLEERSMAEKLTLLSPAVVPEKPSKPNRPALLLIGLVLAMSAGVGFGSMAEYMDNTATRPEQLSMAAGGMPVLSVIPYLETSEERQVRSRNMVYFSGGSVAAVVMFFVSVHYLIRPLDVIFIQVINKMRILF